MADPTRSSLAILAGAPTGRYVLPTSGELPIGSHASCPLRIAAPGVSPQQAVLRLAAGAASLRDLGTPAGVYVNEVRVQGEQALRDGDRIWLGTPKAPGSVLLQCRLVVQAPPQPPPKPQAPPRPQPTPESPSAPSPVPVPVAGDDFFVGEAPAANSSAPDDFVVDDASAAPIEVLPEPEVEGEGETFVEAAVTPETGPAAPAAGEDFFVGDDSQPLPPSEPFAPAADDFFVADGSSASGPAAFVLGEPVPAQIPTATAGTSAREEAKPLVASQAPVPPAAPTALPASSPRPVRPPAVPGAVAPSPRPVVARAAGLPAQRPARPRSGLPGFVLPLAAVVVLAVAAGAAYFVLMITGRPEIRSIAPPRAHVGDVVVLEGQRFASAASDNVVVFGAEAAEVLSASPTRLEVRIPDTGLAPGEEQGLPVRVRVGRKASPLASVVVRQIPRIRGLAPDVALPGEELLIAGSGWSTSGVQVLFGETAALPTEVTATYVRVRIPPLSTGRVLSVVVVSGNERSSAAELVVGRLPALASIEPSAASAGTVVTFAGRGFAGAATDYSVRVGGAAALVVGVAAGSVRAIVPLSAGAGEAPVEIRIRGQQGVATGTLGVGAAPDPIAFRFVAEPLGDLPGRAALVNGLGLVLALADAGGRPAAARAEEAARRLDAAAARLAGGLAPEFQVRPGPASTAIVLAGAEDPVLEVTEADAAAYADGRRPGLTRGRLAVWWAAILGDAALLLKGEAARFVPATTPEGRVLAEVQKTAAQAGTSGVTQAVLAALKPATRDQLRALALRVPASVREP